MEGKTPVYRVPHRPSIIRTSVNTLISVFCTPGAAARGVTFTVSGSILGGLTADALWTHCTDDSTRASREAGEEKPDTAGTTPHTAGRKLESVGYYVANDERETIVRKHYPFYTMVGKRVRSKIRGHCPIYRFYVANDGRETIVRSSCYGWKRGGIQNPEGPALSIPQAAGGGGGGDTRHTNLREKGGGTQDTAGTALSFLLGDSSTGVANKDDPVKSRGKVKRQSKRYALSLSRPII